MSRRHIYVLLLALAAVMLLGTGLTALAGPSEDFAGSAHAVLSEETKSAAARGSCLLCHDGKGLIPGERAAGKDITDPVAMTCDTCHDWGNDKPSSLRQVGASKLAGVPGFVVENGTAASCTTCHNQRKAADSKSLAAKSVPHYSTQGEMIAGIGGFEFAGTSYTNSAHTTVENSCITCHMAEPVEGAEGKVGGHTFRVVNGDVQNTNACVDCHPKATSVNRLAYGDYDGDNKLEGIQSEVHGLIELVQAAVVAKIDGGKGSFHEGHGRIELFDASGKLIEGAYDENVLKAAWNLLFVENDGSAGVHNPPYTVQLLQSSYKALTGKSVPNAKIR